MSGTMRVGVAGLGRMGTVYAGRLLDRGFEVGVWNRSPAKADALLQRGAKGYSSPQALANGNDIIMVSLADEPALETVYSGSDGLSSADLAAKIVLETSTVRPQFVRTLAAVVERAGGAFVDAPVLGTVGPAREGKIVVVAGGDLQAFERVQPLLAALSRRVVHVGPVGTGSTMKLVVNMILATYWQTLGEAIAMGEGNGLTLDAMLDVFIDGPIATPALAVKLPLLRGASLNTVDFDIRGVHKDLTAALSTAESVNVQAQTVAAARANFMAAVDAGFGSEDVTAIVAFACGRKTRRARRQ